MSAAKTESSTSLTVILGDMLRLLTFRLTRERFSELSLRHLAVGVVITWFVGMGRYWDDPDANPAQRLGLGSVVYVFALSAILWLVFKPLAPERVGYFGIAKFVALTAAPAMLYAIPVERFMSLEAAISINIWFLVAVATWRVALLAFFMLRALRLRWYEAVFAGLLPLVAIIVVLTALNLERAVFEIMGGIDPEARTSNDGAYQVLWMLTFLSITAAPLLLVGYLACVVRRVTQRRAAYRKNSAEESATAA